MYVYNKLLNAKILFSDSVQTRRIHRKVAPEWPFRVKAVAGEAPRLAWLDSSEYLETFQTQMKLKKIRYVHVLHSKTTSGFFWTFFRLWRIVDLPEIWGFWRFYLEFWVNSWVFDKFCLILDKNCYIWLKTYLNFWKICWNFEFCAKNSWVLSFF